MAIRLQKNLLRDLFNCVTVPVRFKSQRTTLGKSPAIARNLEQRLEALNYKDPSVHYKVNIGFKPENISRRTVTEERIKCLKKNRSNPELEKAARENRLIIPLEDVEEDWANTTGPNHIKAAAEHYGIFEHLFGDAYFIPVVNVKVSYPEGDGCHPVYRGNHLKPEQTKKAPEIIFKSASDSLWTVLMTTPDGHLENGEKEYVHWLVGNIKGNNVSSGQTIKEYMQPFPCRGLGYLRYIFVLFKQEQPIDCNSLMTQTDSLILSDRTFSTYEFYREREEWLTPAGLAWFQSDWDPSVTDFFQQTIGFQEEPKFSYDFPEHYHPKQTWFPIKQPFNLYMDRYRDEKQIAKEYIAKKLRNLDPFKAPPPKMKFPNAIPFKKYTPSWLKNEIRKERLGHGRSQDY